MKYRRLIDGDMSYGHGNADFLIDQAAAAQAISTHIKWLFNEWWEQQGVGLPMFQSILTHGAQQNKVDLLLSDWIKRLDFVTGIQSLTSQIIERQYQMSCVVSTIYGQTMVNYPIGSNQ
jgi:hypothetical protein